MREAGKSINDDFRGVNFDDTLSKNTVRMERAVKYVSTIQYQLLRCDLTTTQCLFKRCDNEWKRTR